MYSRNAFRKSETFRGANRSTSMQHAYNTPTSPPDHQRYNIPLKNSLSINFPTSPNQPTHGVGEGILHSTRHSHPLFKLIEPNPFTCSGCKEYGAGNTFSCQECDFQLHDFCALSPPLLNNHPLHPQHQLFFHAKPKSGGIYWPKCNICSKSTKGFTFRCNVCNFQIHPCCAMLSNQMSFPVHSHVLKLLSPAFTTTSSTSNQDSLNPCGECGKRKMGGCVYSCTVCDYHLHAACAKNLVNGLQANGIKINSDNKPHNTSSSGRVVGPAVRLASQAVIEFIGGLIEGIGDGVGQALISNVIRGKRGTNRSDNLDHRNTNTLKYN